MSDESTNEKPGAGTPGFARSAFWLLLVASPFYRNGVAGANACLPFLPVAVDGAALLWGGLR